MNTAARATEDRSLIDFATKKTVFSRAVVYDFADGSFLVVHDSGRVEANTITC